MIGKRGLVISVISVLPLFTLFTGCALSNPAPKEVISMAREAIENIKSYRADGMSLITGSEGTSRTSILIEFLSPDSIHQTVYSERGSSETILIGTASYIRETSDTDLTEVETWKTYKLNEFPGYMNTAASMIEYVNSLTGVVRLEDDIINGTDCFHYIVDINAKVIMERKKDKQDLSQAEYEEQLKALENLFSSRQASVEFWIGKDDYLLRKSEQSQEMKHTDNEDRDTKDEKYYRITETYIYYDFNSPVTIEAPTIETSVTE